MFEIAHAFLVSMYAIGLAALLAGVDTLLINRHKPLGKFYHSMKFFVLLGVAIAVYRLTSFIHNPVEILSSMFAYWLFFDIFLNKFRNLPINYITESPDSMIERILRLKDGYRYMFFKAWGWVILMILASIWSTYLGLE